MVFAEIDETLEEGEVLISDILGFDVVLKSGEKLGTLTQINDFGASEIYVVKTDLGEMMFPNVRQVIEDFDMKKKQVVLNQEILEEIRIDN